MSSTSFQQLNLNDAFLFPAALEDPVTCRLILECIVEEPISELMVKAEYTKQYNSEFKCIRLDVYAKDMVTEVSYNLEMQNKNEYNLPLRSRYYQAQIDIGNLKPGVEYEDMRPLYVIFICNFDPFGEKLYRYTFSMQCEEREIPLNDGVRRIFLNTKGKNRDEVPKILMDFLGYLNDSTDAYVEQNFNEKVKEIHKRITELKKNRNVEKRYMHYLYVDKIIEEKELIVKRLETEVQEQETQLQKQETQLQKQETQLQKQETQLQKQETQLQERETQLQEQEMQLQEQEMQLQKAEVALKVAKDFIIEMIFGTIKKIGNPSEVTKERIKNESNISLLKTINEIAVTVDSIEQFEEQIMNLS